MCLTLAVGTSPHHGTFRRKTKLALMVQGNETTGGKKPALALGKFIPMQDAFFFFFLTRNARCIDLSSLGDSANLR